MLRGLVVHMVVAETDEEALAAARSAWDKYRWNLAAPRRLEAEKRNLTQFMSTKDGSFGFFGDRPAGLPTRERGATSTPSSSASISKSSGRIPIVWAA